MFHLKNLLGIIWIGCIVFVYFAYDFHIFCQLSKSATQTLIDKKGGNLSCLIMFAVSVQGLNRTLNEPNSIVLLMQGGQFCSPLSPIPSSQPGIAIGRESPPPKEKKEIRQKNN